MKGAGPVRCAGGKGALVVAGTRVPAGGGAELE